MKCDRVIDGLLKKDLILPKGRSEGIGRPILYGTTDTFLKNFGFTSLKDLPEIEDIEGVINLSEEEGEDDDNGMEQISIEEVEYGEREI